MVNPGCVDFLNAMSVSPKSGGELFIVDNSDDNWKGLKYLQDWTEIASAFDIATVLGARYNEFQTT